MSEHCGGFMGYRDDAEALRQRNIELESERDELRARVAELETQIAEDNTEAVLQRRIEHLEEQNARLRADVARLDPHRTTEEREQREKVEGIQQTLAGVAASLLNND
jgi:predicted  nucleic acid-binding Zn-ribbon protein